MTTLNLPDGTHLAYTVSHEAWYAQGPTVPGRPLIVERPQVMIAASAEGQGGGAAWEFPIEEYDLGGKCLKLGMFGESWQAMAQMPSFFEWLAKEGDNVTLDDVRMALDLMGAVDETARVSPYADSEEG